MDPLIGEVHERGPLTVAAFMDLALYHPELGYYARAPQRSGRAGDFFTSVDVSALFGELLETQVEEMVAILDAQSRDSFARHDIDLVEVGAGNGRLSADLLAAARCRNRAVYDRLRLSLVEASARARADHRQVLGELADRLHHSSPVLPVSFEGVLIANELLDAMPVHQVVMRDHGLQETYVVANGGRLALCDGPLSTPAIADYLAANSIHLYPGWRAEIGLQAVDWLKEAVHRLQRGFLILIDYGHEASELYSASHSSGTLTTFTRHTAWGPDASPSVPSWLMNPGRQDITAHVNFSALLRVAGEEGLTAPAFLDQTYFLLGLVMAAGADLVADDTRRRALKTLIMPGGLGSTHKVLVLVKGVDCPTLRCRTFGARIT